MEEMLLQTIIKINLKSIIIWTKIKKKMTKILKLKNKVRILMLKMKVNKKNLCTKEELENGWIIIIKNHLNFNRLILMLKMMDCQLGKVKMKM